MSSFHLEEVRSSTRKIGMEVEEILSNLAEEPAIGDNGVAELVISIENNCTMLAAKLLNKSHE